MRKVELNNKGFGLVGVVALVVVLAVVGGSAAYVYHRNHKNSAAQVGTSGTHKNTISTNHTTSSADLINVAKKVYYQVAASESNPPTVGGCGAHIDSCPFTASLISKIDAASTPAGSAVLNAGIQNGPFGVISYNASPNSQGGTVAVNLTPDASVGGPAITWKLTLIQNDTQLLVDDIQYSRGAYGSNSACGPVEIYNYPSCSE